MAAAGVDFDCGCERCCCSGSRTAAGRGRRIYSTPIGAADVLARPAAVLRALCGLWGRSDFHPAVVAVFSLQRAIWIAVAAGLRCSDGYRGASDSAAWSVDLAAATGVRAGRVRVGDCSLRLHLVL